jgi:DNA-binding LacI/PurR family transcriptional regulator
MRRRRRKAGDDLDDGARPQTRATIHDIAREAGVSTATVSRFFNQPEKVSATTRDRVRSVIALHHYVSDGLAGGLASRRSRTLGSDGLAGGLASRRSRTLGLIIPTITNSIYAASTQAIQQAAQEAGYTVLVGISEFSREQEATLIHRLLERRVEGLILTGAARDANLYEKISR